MHRDARGRLWAGTNGGLYLLEGDRFVDRVGTTVLPRVLTCSIHEAADGTIWAGTHTGVASITPAGQLRILTTRDGLPVDDVFQIEQDRAGNFWMSSVHGIFGVLSQEMERGRITSVLLLDRADGMASAEGTAGVQPSSWASADGSIWFSTYRVAARLGPLAAIAGRVAAQPPPQ